MEIREVLSYYVDYDDKTLEVEFKTNLDYNDDYRTDRIFFFDIEDFGFDLIPERTNVFDYEYDEYDYNSEDPVELDNETLIEFLNEYYLSYPNKLPKAEF